VSVNDGDLITFTSDVAYGGSKPLNYTWTVSPAGARIVSGTGTATITVDSTGLGNQRVSATLVVDDGSGDPLCRQNAQASTMLVASSSLMVVTGMQTSSKSGSVRRELNPRSRRQPYNRVTCNLRGNAPGPGNRVDQETSKTSTTLAPFGRGALTNR